MAEAQFHALVAERADKDLNFQGNGAADSSIPPLTGILSHTKTSTSTAGSETGSGNGLSSDNIFKFDDETVLENKVFASNAEPEKFAFTKPSDVTLTSLSWLALASNNSYVPLTNVTISSKDSSPEDPTNMLKISIDGSYAQMNFTAAEAQWYSLLGTKDTAMASLMKLQALWYNGDVHGNSSSALFAEYDVGAGVAFSSSASSKLEAYRTGTATGFAGETVIATVTASDDSQAAAGTASGSSSAASSSGKSSSGGGGLSTGATAGIAVGCVIGGLLIIAVLAWFLLRRRRQKNVVRSLQPEQSNAYMVDKETHNRATDSPNSPYSDENQVQQVPLTDLGTTTRDAPVAAYHDTPGRASSSGSHGGAQTPQGMSSNVAHLVEEGMTEDEIRRLEEEERALDDAIERAARR